MKIKYWERNKKASTDSWFKENLTAFASVWSSSVKENVALLLSAYDPCSIFVYNSLQHHCKPKTTPSQTHTERLSQIVTNPMSLYKQKLTTINSLHN